MLISSARGRGGKEKGEDYAITIREYGYNNYLLVYWYRPGYGRDSTNIIFGRSSVSMAT